MSNRYHWISSLLDAPGSITDPRNLSTTRDGPPNVAEPPSADDTVVFMKSARATHYVDDKLPMPHIEARGKIIVAIATLDPTIDASRVKCFNGARVIVKIYEEKDFIGGGECNTRVGKAIAVSEDGKTCTVQHFDENGEPLGDIIEGAILLGTPCECDGLGKNGTTVIAVRIIEYDPDTERATVLLHDSAGELTTTTIENVKTLGKADLDTSNAFRAVREQLNNLDKLIR